MKTALTGQLIVAMIAALIVHAPPAWAASTGECDVDGDGRADLAIGVPYEDLGDAVDAGGVHVLHGDAGARLQPRGDDLWHQDDAGIGGVAGAMDGLGTAVTCGDFDGDGFSDIAAGVPGEVVEGDRSGAVQVLYGGRGGIARRDDLWHQADDGVKGAAENGDRFGASLAAGDFDGDGRDDLVVGIPGEGVGGSARAGAVQVLYGSASGVSARDDLWHQDDAGIQGTVRTGDRFGGSVAAGDFDGDGNDDLVVGIPGENPSGRRDAGAVQVLYGSASGLSARDNLWHQDSDGIKGGSERFDSFAHAVVVGDFDADGADDLAVGVAGEGIGGKLHAGAVQVLYGAAPGGLTARDQLWHQDTDGIAAVAEPADEFGASIAAGDFDGDDHEDLAVGVPGEILGGRDYGGAVHVLYGGSGGVSVRDQLWHQNQAGVDGRVETGDLFGFDVSAADLDADGFADLAVGVGGEGIGGSRGAGATQTLYGGDAGLTSQGAMWHQASRGVTGGAEAGDGMGWAVSGRRFRPQIKVAYQLGTKGDVESDFSTFRKRVTDTLRNHAGWSLSGAVEFVPAGFSAELRIWLADPQAVDNAAPVCSAQWSCRVGDDVYINEERWDHATETYSDRSLKDYRHYVVTHEVGHWLELDHAECPRQGAPAPVMMQESKSLDGCRTRVWPLPRERAAARRNLHLVDEQP